MRERLIWHEGKFIPVAQYHALDRARRSQKHSDALPTPMVMGDLTEHRNIATGEVVSSRSRHREILREHGLVELGNERIEPRRPYEPQGVEQDMKQAFDYLSGGGAAHRAEHDIIPED